MNETPANTPKTDALETVDLDDVLSGGAYRKRKMTRFTITAGSIVALLIAALFSYYIGYKGHTISIQWNNPFHQTTFTTVPTELRSNIIPFTINVNNLQTFTIASSNALLYLSLANQNTIQFSAGIALIKVCQFTLHNTSVLTQSGSFCSAIALQGSNLNAKIGLRFSFGMNDAMQLSQSLSPMNLTFINALQKYTVSVPAGTMYLSGYSATQSQLYNTAKTAINGFYFFQPTGADIPANLTANEQEFGSSTAIFLEIPVNEYWQFMGEAAPILLRQTPDPASFITVKFEFETQTNMINTSISNVTGEVSPECLAAIGGLNYYIGTLGYRITLQTDQAALGCVLNATDTKTNAGADARYFFHNGVFLNGNSAAQALTPQFPFVS